PHLHRGGRPPGRVLEEERLQREIVAEAAGHSPLCWKAAISAAALGCGCAKRLTPPLSSSCAGRGVSLRRRWRLGAAEQVEYLADRSFSADVLRQRQVSLDLVAVAATFLHLVAVAGVSKVSARPIGRACSDVEGGGQP